MVVDINPIIAQIGPLALRWYGLMYAVGILVGLWVMIPYAIQRGTSEDDIWLVFWPAVIAGLIGARLYYVVQSDPARYLAEPWRILATWEGGMAYYGAVFAVPLAIIAVCRWRRIPILPLLDATCIFAVVGQGIGRIGNIVNGDVVGYPTTLPWGFKYVNPGSFVPDHTIFYQPAAVYELLFNIFLFAVLWRLRFRLKPAGTLLVTYLAAYSVGQFVLFFWRMNEVVAFGLKQAQLTSIVVLIACIPLFWFVRRHGAKTAEQAKVAAEVQKAPEAQGAPPTENSAG